MRISKSGYKIQRIKHLGKATCSHKLTGTVIIGRITGFYDKRIIELFIDGSFYPLYRPSYKVKAYTEGDEDAKGK